MKKIFLIITTLIMSTVMLTACGSKPDFNEAYENARSYVNEKYNGAYPFNDKVYEDVVQLESDGSGILGRVDTKPNTRLFGYFCPVRR